MNPIEALQASGLNPIVIDEDTDLDSALGELLGETEPRQRETNVEFITRIMEFCPTGPLVQPFIMHAVEMYCQLVKETDASEFSNGLFSGESWKATGEWIESEINKHYAKG